jgi:porphobilinogen synthase
MPGCYNLSIDELVKEVEASVRVGVRSVILFGVPDQKDATGTGAYAEDGITQRAIRAVKREVNGAFVIADNCLCEYTDHGHCGVIRDGEVLNDPTLDLLARTAVSQAEAGADIIAPSNMMDGFVAAIRSALDESGFEHLPIMSYAVKYASGFYGPFREAALDVEQGADMLMVKPALAYLDVIRAVRERFDLPLAAYQVSGEYSMIKAAARLGWIDEERIVMETLTAIKRAGADVILTYFAREVAARLA